MRYLITPFLIAAFYCSFGQSGQEPSDQTILNLENKLREAIINRDAAFLKAVYDESYTGILPTGQMVDRAGIVEYFTSGSPYVVLTFEDVKVRVVNTIGISSGMMVTRSKSGTLIGQSRFLRVYQNINGSWRIIEAQGTIVIAR